MNQFHMPSPESRYRITYEGLALQSGLRQFLAGKEFTHWVTLNTHADISMDELVTYLHLWAKRVVERMFRGSSFGALFTENLFGFFAFPEYTRLGHPHLHLLVFVHAHRHMWFQRIAEKQWLRICRAGTADIQRIKATHVDNVRVQIYATKYADRAFSHNEFLTSNMFNLGLPCTRRKSKLHPDAAHNL